MSNVFDKEPHSRLTRREMECLTEAANGLSAKEIAIELEIAPRTVERHLDQVRIKLNARNRVHMVSQAIRDGLLDAYAPRRPEPLPRSGQAPLATPGSRTVKAWAVPAGGTGSARTHLTGPAHHKPPA
ncbi:response regulator transcription factor [Glycocaulis sp.]